MIGAPYNLRYPESVKGYQREDEKFKNLNYSELWLTWTLICAINKFLLRLNRKQL